MATATVVGGVGSLAIFQFAVATVWYGVFPVIGFRALLKFVTAPTPHALRGLSAIFRDVSNFLAVSGLIGFQP
jgi:hypothetical protein